MKNEFYLYPVPAVPSHCTLFRLTHPLVFYLSGGHSYSVFIFVHTLYFSHCLLSNAITICKMVKIYLNQNCCIFFSQVVGNFIQLYQ